MECKFNQLNSTECVWITFRLSIGTYNRRFSIYVVGYTFWFYIIIISLCSLCQEVKSSNNTNRGDDFNELAIRYLLQNHLRKIQNIRESLTILKEFKSYKMTNVIASYFIML